MSLLFFHSIFAFHAGDLVSYNSPSEGITVGIIEQIFPTGQVIVRQALHGSRKGSKISDGYGNSLFGFDITDVKNLESFSVIEKEQIKFRTHTKGGGHSKSGYVLASYTKILLVTDSAQCVQTYNANKIAYFNEINDCNNRVVSRKDLF